MDYQKIKVNHNILVLNADYNPINICDGRRAIVLLLKQKAQFITNKVIRLLEYIRIPFTKIMSHKPSRSMIHRRDNYECNYCGSTENITVDHIIPESRGGLNSWENLTTACSKCNAKKGNKTPEEANMPLRRPAKAPFNKIHLTINSSNNPDWRQYVYAT
jgi:hypothetical protein